MKRCDCGKPSRITFGGQEKCWDCYHYLLMKLGKEDWRDEMVHEKMLELGLIQEDNEPDWVIAERAKKLLKRMGGMSDLVLGQSQGHD